MYEQKVRSGTSDETEYRKSVCQRRPAGTAGRFRGRRPLLNKDAAVAYLKDCDEHITDLDIVIARPGDDTRIVPVIETIEPRCRMDGRCLFPGVTDDVVPAGDGELKALKGCCVTVVAKNWGSFGDGVIDMGSEGAKHTYWSKLVNICLVGDTDEEFERHEQQKCNHALRWAGHRLAEYLGKIVKDLPAEDTEEYVFDLSAGSITSSTAPSVPAPPRRRPGAWPRR